MPFLKYPLEPGSGKWLDCLETVSHYNPKIFLAAGLDICLLGSVSLCSWIQNLAFTLKYPEWWDFLNVASHFQDISDSENCDVILALVLSLSSCNNIFTCMLWGQPELTLLYSQQELLFLSCWSACRLWSHSQICTQSSGWQLNSTSVHPP